MSEKTTVGAVVAAFLEQCGISTAFGVISIHNMPILDALGERGRMRFVPSRGEAGALNMADAFARVSGGLGVAVTSTGTAAGNAAGGMVEALTAGSPVLHLTGQIELPYLDRDRAYIHEAPDQLNMLRAVSKQAFRVWSPETALGTLKEAVRVALTAPAGPVSVEIPIDVQAAEIPWPAELAPINPQPVTPSESGLDTLADRLAHATRPMLWLGGGARHAGETVKRLVNLGFGVVTSTQGRGILPEGHPMSLGAFNMHAAAESFYGTCDAMVVVGSRLRGNETLKYSLDLPQPLYQIDADARAENRSYRTERFVHGDAQLALDGLADRLENRMAVDPTFSTDLRTAWETAVADMRESLGPYDRLVAAVEAALGDDYLWVRDVTISNSTWGNRLLPVRGPRDGVHAVGGGIGQGVPMGIGAAIAAGRTTLCLVGDGGFQLSMGELACAAQEQADTTYLLMNSGGYGVIKNIQDACYGARHHYVDLHTPDFAKYCECVGVSHWRVHSLDDAQSALEAALGRSGPAVVEVDMGAIGEFARPFAGPPVRKLDIEES